MQKLTLCALVSATTLLSACGGSSGGNTPITLDEINDVALDIFNLGNDLDDDTIDFISQDDLIATGSADYTGFMFAGVDETDDVFVGRAEVAADFTNGGSLSGSATDFVTFVDPSSDDVFEIEDDIPFEPLAAGTELTPVDGEITLSGGEIGASPFGAFGAIDIDIEGTITIPADISITDNQEVYDITGDLVGAVTTTDVFVAEGSFDATSPGATFSGLAFIVAD